MRSSSRVSRKGSPIEQHKTSRTSEHVSRRASCSGVSMPCSPALRTLSTSTTAGDISFRPTGAGACRAASPAGVCSIETTLRTSGVSLHRSLKPRFSSVRTILDTWDFETPSLFWSSSRLGRRLTASRERLECKPGVRVGRGGVISSLCLPVPDSFLQALPFSDSPECSLNYTSSVNLCFWFRDRLMLCYRDTRVSERKGLYAAI
jgi:hypothetical protein